MLISSSAVQASTVAGRPISFATNLPLSASAHLDAARVLAAQIVLLGHIRVLFLVDYFDIAPKPGFVTKLLYWICGLQHESVIVFFVLSGLLISRSVIHSWETGTWLWRDYLTDRLVRLYVVLIPGLLIGLLWDGLGYGLPSSHWLYAEPLARFEDVTIASQLTLRAFIANLTFQQTILHSAFGSNLPLWSLACEFWYYMLFPLLFFGALGWRRRGRHNGTRSLRRSAQYFALAGLVLWLLGWEKIVWFVVWLFGFAVWVLNQRFRLRRPMRPVVLCSGALLLIATLSIARMRVLSLWSSDLVVGAVFALFVLALLQTGPPSSARYLRLARVAAGFSYSEYITHFPLIVFICAALGSHARWQPDTLHLAYVVIVAVAAILYAYIFSVLTESHTRTVKGWIRRKEALSLVTGETPLNGAPLAQEFIPATERRANCHEGI
jgi:peptidoglycan/LPS O-acetylase OafA/YrhL